MSDAMTMTVAHLATTLATTRLRERERCVRVVADRRDEALGNGDVALAGVLDILVESLRAGAGATGPAIVKAAADADLLRDQTETAALAQVEQEARQRDGSGLPPVHHLDDFEEGVSLVRGLAGRKTFRGEA